MNSGGGGLDVHPVLLDLTYKPFASYELFIFNFSQFTG